MGNPNCGACGHMNTRGFCNLTACIFPCPTGMGGYINKPPTNADRIRAMTDEELAENFETLCPSYNWTLALNGMTWLEWLKQEVDT